MDRRLSRREPCPSSLVIFAETHCSYRGGDAVVRLVGYPCHLSRRPLGDPASHVGYVISYAREQGRPARPLPAPAHEVETGHRRDAPLVDETATGVLDLGDGYPFAVVFVSRRPDHCIHLGRLTAGEADLLPVCVGQPAHHPDAPPA